MSGSLRAVLFDLDGTLVGDTVWDVQASRKAGVPCIGLLSGDIGREELADAGAAHIYAAPASCSPGLSDSLIRG